MQSLPFIGGVSAKFEVRKELASMNSLHRPTTDKNIFKEVEKILIQYKLKQDLVGVLTKDGSKNICEAEKSSLDKFTKLVKMYDI